MAPGTLAALTASAMKWYRGAGTPEQGARTYYLMYMRKSGRSGIPGFDFHHLQQQDVAQSVPRSSAHQVLHVLVATRNEHQAVVSSERNSGFRSRHPSLTRSCAVAMQTYKLLPAGDTARVVEFGDNIDQCASASA